MQAKWGLAWLVTAIWLILLTCAPAPGLADGDSLFRPIPVLPISAQSSLETQMQGEKPLPPAGPNFTGVPAGPSLQLHNEGARRQPQAAFQNRDDHLHPL